MDERRAREEEDGNRLRREGSAPVELSSLERVLGSFGEDPEGPLFLFTAGIHGNERAGVEAVQRVFAALRERDGTPVGRFQGRCVAFAGNLKGLQKGVRYLDQDLNRLWTPKKLANLLARDPRKDDAEEAEARELLGCFEKELSRAKGKVLIMDLHTSSADGPPFSCMGDTIPNRKLAFALPVPVILGLEEAIDGAMLDWFYENGHVAIAVEGGKHESKETVDNLEAMVWISLVAAGNLCAREVPRLGDFQRLLEREVRGIPHIVEIRYREVIRRGENFHMIPGFKTFDWIPKGTALAEKDGRVLRAEEDSYVLLPLYQGQGEDGFFLGRRVPRFWLLLASLLRRLRASKLLPLLPGVRRHPGKKDCFMVDPKIARWGTVQVFHLLGYRRRRPEGDQLVFSRRPQW